MAEQATPAVGSIGWIDLTVPDAENLRAFYAEVAGWSSQPISMGDYSDYVMTRPESGDGVAGICHRRGPNQDIPPVWLIYIVVADLDGSIQACKALGGEVIVGPRGAGGGRFAVIRDPAGVVTGLYETGGDKAANA